MNLRGAALFLIGFTSLVSCRPAPEWGGEGKACDSNAECGRTLECIDGVCTADSDDPSDAGADATPEPDAANPTDDLGATDLGSDTGPDAAPDLGACDGECADPTPVCNVATDTCVACLVTEDCAQGVCDTTNNECVGCLSNTDCTGPTASSCDVATNTCVGCTDSTACTHLAATTVCDVDATTCVPCTGTEYAACNGVCDSRLNTCTDFPAGELGLCEACVSDAQCRPGMYCVPMDYEAADGSGPAEVGTFCLWDRDTTEADGPAGACSTVRPYILAELAQTIDGVDVTICALNLASCPSLKDFASACPGAGMNDSCGAPGFEDGLCVAFDAASNLCTTLCGGDNDCETGFSCDGTITPKRCRLTTN